MNTVTLSSRRHDWETPQRLFDALNAEFGFTLDAAATRDNAKCAAFFSPDEDGLSQSWATLGAVWINPPYGPGIGKWVKKAYDECRASWQTVVLLIPARTETSWWHEYAMKASEIRLIRGRLRFSAADDFVPNQKGHNAPFPSAVVVFRPGDMGEPRFTAMDRILDTEEEVTCVGDGSTDTAMIGSTE